MLGIISIVTVIVCVQALSENVESLNGQVTSSHFDTVARIAEDGYYSESHKVTTSDGYILEVNRIPFGRDGTKGSARTSKPVVFLMHGLQSCGMSYIVLGPGRGLAYILADEGYDVWMGNARGVLNSRNHVTLNPDSANDHAKFFDFSFDDIGTKDVPAMIDYILNLTRRPQLHYIGHSQGGTSFLILNSMLPQYNNKIASANLLAGVGYQNHFPNRMLRLLAVSSNTLYRYALRRGIIEIFGPEWTSPALNDCAEETQEACSLINLNEIMANLLGPLEIIGGSSIKQYAHFGQNINDKSFRRWYYSPIMNLLKYGSVNPPRYDITRITTDVTMHYTISDSLLDERDVIAMANDMPNTKVRKVARDTFSHVDFVNSPDAKELVYDYIVQELKKYKN